MASFADILAVADRFDDGFALDVPASWLQGRTAYGGFSSALALAAAQRACGSTLPPLRSAQFAMIAPVSGRVEARAQVQRKGRNATWIAARISGEQGVAFTASFVFMGAVDSSLHINDRPVPEGLLPVSEARAVGYTAYTPAFVTNNFEMKHALAPKAMRQPEICRWVRLNDRDVDLDATVQLLLVADAIPPGVMPMLDAAVPVSTMHWQVNLLAPVPRTQGGWWLLRSRGDYAERGCSSQTMAIWNAGQEPVMAGMQSVALFG